MNSPEESHASQPAMPKPAMASLSAEAIRTRLISTKLTGHILEDEDIYESPTTHLRPSSEPPSSAVAWFRSRVLTPARDKLKQVSVRPMVDSLRDIRGSLSFGSSPKSRRNPSPSFLEAESTPMKRSSALSKSTPAPTDAPQHSTITTQYEECPSPALLEVSGERTAPLRHRSLQPARSVAPMGGAATAQPTATSSTRMAESEAIDPKEKVSTIPSAVREEIERAETTQLPSSDLLEKEFQRLQEKVQGFSDSLSIFSTTCDRLAFDLEQGQQFQQQQQHAFMSTVKGFLENLEKQSSESAAQNRTAIDQLRSETKDGLSGLLQIINSNINPTNQSPEGFPADTPLQERNPAAKDPKAPSDPNPAAEKAGSLLPGAPQQQQQQQHHHQQQQQQLSSTLSSLPSAPQCDTSAAPFKGAATGTDYNTTPKEIHSPQPLTLQQKTKKTLRALQNRARTYYHQQKRKRKDSPVQG